MLNPPPPATSRHIARACVRLGAHLLNLGGALPAAAPLLLYGVSGCTTEQFVKADNRAPSAEIPGGLEARQIPQFVAIGWDDNGSIEGMEWSLELLRGYKNPGHDGGLGTYDGQPITATYFDTSAYAPSLALLWRKAFDAGHEIGNHTKTHGTGLQGPGCPASEADCRGSDDYDLWLSEMQACQETLVHEVGIPDEAIAGFRTPFLATSDATLRAVDAMGFVYDASLEEGFQPDQDGSDFLWPYTLDSGSPGNEFFLRTNSKKAIKPHAGLWELPVYAVIVPPDAVAESYGIPAGLRGRLADRRAWFKIDQGKITGFDYNLWMDEFALSPAEVLATLKYTLDQHLRGNRAPMLFGAHTQLYTNADLPRRAAIEEFIEYALSKPDVRIVGFRKVLEWLRNPTPLR